MIWNSKWLKVWNIHTHLCKRLWVLVEPSFLCIDFLSYFYNSCFTQMKILWIWCGTALPFAFPLWPSLSCAFIAVTKAPGPGSGREQQTFLSQVPALHHLVAPAHTSVTPHPVRSHPESDFNQGHLFLIIIENNKKIRKPSSYQLLSYWPSQSRGVTLPA